MGGPGSGAGAKVGSGRKPKAERWLRGRPQSRRPKPPRVVVLSPPDDLSAAERDIWARLAPHATAAGTLTPATGLDFRALCELTVEASELLVRRRAAGWDKEGRSLSTAYRLVVQRLEVKMRGFGLSPIGKPMWVAFAPEEEPDAFEAFDVM